MNCKNCGTEVTQNFCPNCGQALTLKRIDRHYLVHEMEHVLHIERGFLYTVRELFLRPGASVKTYISENRSRLVKPIIFIILCSVLYSLMDYFFHVEDNYFTTQPKTDRAAEGIATWVQNHYGYANIIMGLFIAFWTKLFFRKSGYNFFEILILLCFTIGMGMLLLSVALLIEGLFHWDLFVMSTLLVFAYCTWAIAQFFDGKKVINYVKSFFAYLLGMISSFVFAFVLGAIIDLFTKH